MLAALCLSIAAALALRQITARWPRFARAIPAMACVGNSGRWLAATDRHGEAAGSSAESTRASSRDSICRRCRRTTASRSYRATEHKRPLFNGYSGYFAPHYWAMQYMIKQHDPAVLTRLSSLRADRGRDRSRLGSRATVCDDFLLAAPQVIARLSGRSIFIVPSRTRPLRLGASESAGAATADCVDHGAVQRSDRGRDDRWRHQDEMGVRPRAAARRHLHDRPRLRAAGRLAPSSLIAGFVADFPRKLLDRDVADDGSSWSTAWNGDAAIVALSAALEDPLNIPMPFTFEPRPARYRALHPTGNEETYYWSVAELRIVGESGTLTCSGDCGDVLDHCLCRRILRLLHVERARHGPARWLRHGGADGDDPAGRYPEVSETRVPGYPGHCSGSGCLPRPPAGFRDGRTKSGTGHEPSTSFFEADRDGRLYRLAADLRLQRHECAEPGRCCRRFPAREASSRRRVTRRRPG